MKSTIGLKRVEVSQAVRLQESHFEIAASSRKLLLEGIHSQEPVAGFTHAFYKYPARFSPLFARAVIQAFTEPGDAVYDPFMGGGTTIVEAVALGRKAIGTDINSLAVFLSKVKTTLYTESDRRSIQKWVSELAPRLNVSRMVDRSEFRSHTNSQINISTRATWRIRKLVELGLAELKVLRTAKRRAFVRCTLLRTAQWALDCRKEIPSAQDFREQFLINVDEMLGAAEEYCRKVVGVRFRQSFFMKPQCLHRSAVGVETDPRLSCARIKLVLTSPPYPGVHVLYHRWQVLGRRETPAPYWIANVVDGNGASYYTFGDRKEVSLDSYYGQAYSAYSSIARIATPTTVIVQMIAFPKPYWQLHRYLETMERAGLKEIRFPDLANSPDGRIWRSVPNRKWYASQKGSIGSSNEVVLFHRVRS